MTAAPACAALAKEIATTARSSRQLARLARQADVIHSNSLWIHLDAAVAGRLARRPVVLELHDLVRPGLGRRVLRAAVGLASRTVAVSRAVADTLGPASATGAGRPAGRRHGALPSRAHPTHRGGPA